MDKDVLVAEGQSLVRHLDTTKMKPRGAIWVYSSDTDTWKFWIVPPADALDKREFYRIVSETISGHRDDMPALDVGLVEMTKEDHPAIVGLGQFLRMEGIGSATFTNNRFNGFYMPDGVVIRMAL